MRETQIEKVRQGIVAEVECEDCPHVTTVLTDHFVAANKFDGDLYRFQCDACGAHNEYRH